MNERDLNKLLLDNEFLNRKIKNYIDKKLLTKQEPHKIESGEHAVKADHNLNFAKNNINTYSDWAIVGCYYALYHIALALILKKGFSSKNHDATLCVLIKYYYKKHLTEEDIMLLNEIYLDNQDILFYVQAKQEREKAAYSSKIFLDEKKTKELHLKTVLFVSKCKKILEDS
ncbi:MAG: DNA-binding protein [archaeon]